MKLFKIMWCLVFGHDYDPLPNGHAWLAIDGIRVLTCKRCRFVVVDEVEK